MASSSTSSSINRLTKSATLFLILCFITFPSESDGSSMKLGSWPPRCSNKCLSCRPCTAALVSSQQHGVGYNGESEEESYYLLSWKCKCGDKLFQP